MARSSSSHHTHHRPYRDWRTSRLATFLFSSSSSHHSSPYNRRQPTTTTAAVITPTNTIRILCKLVLLLGGSYLYAYTFFNGQPDRSYTIIKRQNDDEKLRQKLRHAQLLAAKRGEDLDIIPEIDGGLMDEGTVPEWQRKMRATAGGNMAWKREQEQLAAAAHSNLRHHHHRHSYSSNNNSGSGHNLRGGGGKSGEGGGSSSSSSSSTSSPPPPSSPILDMLVMMSVFVITRSIVRACMFYRQFSRIIQASEGGGGGGAGGGGGLPAPLPFPLASFPSSSFPTPRMNSNNNNNTRTGRTTRNSRRRSNSSNNNTNTNNANDDAANDTRAASLLAARLMVPPSMHYASLIRNARFRQWVDELNEQRQSNGQPPLSSETLRTLMRESDFDGDDYDALMRLQDEANNNGTANNPNQDGTTTMGATPAEIEACCPQRRILDPNDELLSSTSSSNPGHYQQQQSSQECVICLQKFQLQDQVRKLPCQHEFHSRCIDPWLSKKAACPICKHPIIV